MDQSWGLLLAVGWILLFALGILYVLSPLIIMSRLAKLNRQMDDVLHELRRANPLTKKL
jgi:hypothetical protein